MMSEETMQQKALLLERRDEQQYLKKAFDNAKEQIAMAQQENAQTVDISQHITDISNTIMDTVPFNEAMIVQAADPITETRFHSFGLLDFSIFLIAFLAVSSIIYTVINKFRKYRIQYNIYKQLQQRKRLLNISASQYDCCKAYYILIQN